MKNSNLVALGFTAAMIFAGSALAQRPADAGWYLGGAIGQSEDQDACTGVGGVGVSCDEKDTAWKIFGGYQYNRSLAVEIGYTDLGEISASQAGVGSATIETSAWELVGVGSLPLMERFSVYGKLGLYRAESDARGTGAFAGTASEDNTDLTWGFGVRYDFTRNVGLRAEWQRYSDVGGGQIGESDIDVLSLGVVVKF